MTTVKITGWKAGFRKVSFTALLREFAGLSLSRAHQATVDVTEGRVVELQIEDVGNALEFNRRATELGAISELSK